MSASRSRLVCSRTSVKHGTQKRRGLGKVLEGWGTSKQVAPITMSALQRLHGDRRPAVFASGRPSDEPMSDGVLPFDILEFLHLADEAVEDVGEQ